MKTIREYLAEILETEGYDAWEAADEEAWELSGREDESFAVWAEEHGVDISDTEELQQWAWEHE